ncbi:hypothetical protein [Streptomyces sp. NPDC016626]
MGEGVGLAAGLVHLDGFTGVLNEEAAEPVWTSIGWRLVRDNC